MYVINLVERPEVVVSVFGMLKEDDMNYDKTKVQTDHKVPARLKSASGGGVVNCASIALN